MPKHVTITIENTQVKTVRDTSQVNRPGALYRNLSSLNLHKNHVVIILFNHIRWRHTRSRRRHQSQLNDLINCPSTRFFKKRESYARREKTILYLEKQCSKPDHSALAEEVRMKRNDGTASYWSRFSLAPRMIKRRKSNEDLILFIRGEFQRRCRVARKTRCCGPDYYESPPLP